MTTNPTMELSGRASAPCETGSSLSSHRVLVRNFGSRLVEYRRCETAWRDALGTDEEEPAVGILNEQFLRLLAFPCLSTETLVSKVGTILADGEMTEWLGNDEEAVRVLLSSFLCVSAAATSGPYLVQEAATAQPSAAHFDEGIKMAIDLLGVLSPCDATVPRVTDPRVVSEIITGAVQILGEVASGLSSAKRGAGDE